MSLHVSPIPAFDSDQVSNLARHLRYNGTRVAEGTESSYDGTLLTEVVVVYVFDDEGQDWYGVYDEGTLDDAMVTDSFEVAREMMESLADEIAPEGVWDFVQVSPSP